MRRWFSKRWCTSFMLLSNSPQLLPDFRLTEPLYLSKMSGDIEVFAL